jgi:hypothetical protein
MISLLIVVGQFAVCYVRPDWDGSVNLLPFVLILGRFLGIRHPETEDNTPLDSRRMILGVIAFVIFVISFSPTPFIVIE